MVVTSAQLVITVLVPTPNKLRPHPEPTFRASTGGIDKTTDCSPCPQGYYCEHYGSTNYVICDEGWYCNANEVSATPENQFCPKGHFCTQGLKN